MLHVVRAQDNGIMLLLPKPSHSSFLPLIECAEVGLPNVCIKLRQAEFGLLQADWWLAFSTAQV